MRVLLLTDSLGCPRDEVGVDDTWTDKILSEFAGSNIIFYTWCSYGMSASDIPMAYIGYLKPDLIICQVGIVDACRRALKVNEQRYIAKIPGLRKLVWWICSKNHYNITKMREIHRVGLTDFDKTIGALEKLASRGIAIIEIAPPGGFLVRKTYNVEFDVARYNDVIYSKAKKRNVDIIRPFNNYGLEKRNEYILEIDGHHLNKKGHNMVYEDVSKYILSMLQ